MLLRPLDASDAETLASWEADDVLCAHAGWRPHATHGEAVAWWRARIAAGDPRLVRLLALHDGQAVGYLDLAGDDGSGSRELGYLVGPSARWGQGLGTAVARAGLAHGLGTLGLHHIWAEALEANTASVRVLVRLGLRETGGGDVEDFLGWASRYRRFEIGRDEWLARPDDQDLPAPPC